MSFWYNPSVVGVEKYLISNYNSNTAGGNANGTGFIVAIQTNNTIGIAIYNTGFTTLYSTATLSVNTWHHVVITRKSATGTKVYVNGTLSNSNTSTKDPIYPQATYQSSIGQSPGFGGFVNGKMDSISIWNKELTQSEITELYNSGNGSQYVTDSFYKPTTNDALGTNNGTAQGGLTYTTGKIGNAFQSNGTNSYISLPDNSLNFTGDFSISTWIYLTGLGTWQEVISNYFNTAMTQSGWDIAISPVGVLNFSTYRSNTIYSALPYNVSSYLNQWVHLVVTRKPTVSNGHKIYINGNLVAQQTGLDPVYNSTQWCNINSLKYNSGVSYHLLNGSKIDALTTWTKELTQSEITELYNSGTGKQYPY
jgi:hypothetical protein